MNTGAKFKDPAAVREIIACYNQEMLHRGRKAVQDSRNLHGNAGRVGPDGKPLVVEMVPLSDLEIKLGIDGVYQFRFFAVGKFEQSGHFRQSHRCPYSSCNM